MTYKQQHNCAIELNKKAIATIWEYTEAIWAKQNDILHANSNKTQAIVHARINATIHKIYKDKEYCSDQHQQHFKNTNQVYTMQTIKGKTQMALCCTTNN